MNRYVYSDPHTYTINQENIHVDAEGTHSKIPKNTPLVLKVGEYFVIPENSNDIDALMAMNTIHLVNGEDYYGLPKSERGAAFSKLNLKIEW